MTPERALELFLEHQGAISYRHNPFEGSTEVVVTLQGHHHGAAWRVRSLSKTFTFITALERALAARGEYLSR